MGAQTSRNNRLLIIGALTLGAGACASSGAEQSAGAAPPPSNLQAGILLAHARGLQEKKGCAAAAPSLRVAAAMGAGFEPAQHELGECLMTMTGANETEIALFRAEGEFWIARAAWAGNARAQRFLAVSNGAAGKGAAANLEALKWALVYMNNGEAAVYGYKALPETFVPGLRNALPAEDVAEAEAFARAFAPIALAAYEPPPMPNLKARPPRGMPPGGPGGPGGQRPRGPGGL